MRLPSSTSEVRRLTSVDSLDARDATIPRTISKHRHWPSRPVPRLAARQRVARDTILRVRAAFCGVFAELTLRTLRSDDLGLFEPRPPTPIRLIPTADSYDLYPDAPDPPPVVAWPPSFFPTDSTAEPRPASSSTPYLIPTPILPASTPNNIFWSQPFEPAPQTRPPLHAPSRRSPSTGFAATLPTVTDDESHFPESSTSHAPVGWTEWTDHHPGPRPHPQLESSGSVRLATNEARDRNVDDWGPRVPQAAFPQEREWLPVGVVPVCAMEGILPTESLVAVSTEPLATELTRRRHLSSAQRSHSEPSLVLDTVMEKRSESQ